MGALEILFIIIITIIIIMYLYTCILMLCMLSLKEEENPIAEYITFAGSDVLLKCD